MQLIKDTSDKIECKLGECHTSDTFLTGTFGNQGKYKIKEIDLFGLITVVSIAGPKEMVLRPDFTVYRDKQLWEKLTEFDCNKGFACGLIEGSELLIDRVDLTNTEDIISLLYGV